MNPVAVLNAALTGRYEIEREIGAGGMATVYLARDLKHDRHVALKVLRPELGAVLGPDRFLSEIRVTANLQHPHLLPLFDSGEAEGLLFYVMPYVEGETLRDRLERERQLPVDEAIRIATAVASALHYAHKHHIIHRDLKPENILLQEGQPVVSDFGIALAVTNAGGARITQTGLSLGTPQYMSPEQATGDRQIDARTDIYSLAVVLYEMLVGDPPHTGSTVQGIIAKVLTDRPRSVRATRESVPEHVEFALDRALAKLPADRWASAAEFSDALNGKAVAFPSGVSTRQAAASRPERSGRQRALAALSWIGIAVLVIAASWGWIRPQPRRPSTSRFLLTFPEDRKHTPTTFGTTLTLSADGRRLVYVGGKGSLFVRALDDLEPHPLPGTDGGSSPFFSPDGEWVAFFADLQLKKIALAGGSPVVLATISAGLAHGSWGDDGFIIVANGSPSRLSRVSAEGGVPQLLPWPDTIPGEIEQRWPLVLAGGRQVVYTSWTGDVLTARLAVADVRSGHTRLLGQAGASARYASGTHLIVAMGTGTVMAVPFDVRRARVTGPAFPVLDRVVVKSGGAATFAVAHNGTVVYSEGDIATAIAIVDRAGRGESLVESPRTLASYGAPRFSPDGRRIAMELSSSTGSGSGPSDIWIFDLSTRALSRLTFEGINRYPVWTPDGKRVAFSSVRDSTRPEENGAYWQVSDGSAPPEKLLGGLRGLVEVAFSPDGRTLVFREIDPKGGRNIGVMSLSGNREPRMLLQSRFHEGAPGISPDGHWLAYVSNESGTFEVYVRPFPGMDGRWQVSSGGGTQPVWSPDGLDLYYWADNDLVAARIAKGRTFELIGRSVPFSLPHSVNSGHAEFDVHPNGKSFVVKRQLTGPERTIAVLNWLDEVRRRGEAAKGR